MTFCHMTTLLKVYFCILNLYAADAIPFLEYGETEVHSRFLIYTICHG
jgi:hypothetical protein